MRWVIGGPGYVAKVERGESSGRVVLVVLVALVLVAGITLWATRPAPDPTSVSECHKQGGSVEVFPNGKAWCWQRVGEPDEDEYNHVRIPTTIPPTGNQWTND